MDMKYNKFSAGSFWREEYCRIIDDVSSDGRALHVKIKCEGEYTQLPHGSKVP
jgi:hypothetical protein